MIGFPLRLLAREIYDRIVGRSKGAAAVALITGEEKLRPPRPQLFRLHRRGDADRARAGRLPRGRRDPARAPTTSAATSSPTGCCTPAAARRRCSWARTRSGRSSSGWCRRPRSSAGRASRPCPLPAPASCTACRARSAVVAFSAAEVYALAEVIRRQSGGAAVVLGALSPAHPQRPGRDVPGRRGRPSGRHRRDRHGPQHGRRPCRLRRPAPSSTASEPRRLRAPEMAQIAGRAGRHMAGRHLRHHRRLGPLEPRESRRSRATASRRSAAALAQQRARLRSLEALLASLDAPPPADCLLKVARRHRPPQPGVPGAARRVARVATTPSGVRLLWQVCQIPDFRKTLTDAHLHLLATCSGT